MHHLNTDFKAKDKDRYIFYFSKLGKSWRKGQAPPAIIYFALCVVETLNEYINPSKSWRESNHKKQLVLSSKRPHNAVVSCTMSGWLKKTFKQAGINTDLFKAHSTRSASSSKASVGRPSLVEILKSGSWSLIMIIISYRTAELGSTQLSELRLGKFSIRSRRFYEIKFSNDIRV